jgi:hypothetical protein
VHSKETGEHWYVKVLGASSWGLAMRISPERRERWPRAVVLTAGLTVEEGDSQAAGVQTSYNLADTSGEAVLDACRSDRVYLTYPALFVLVLLLVVQATRATSFWLAEVACRRFALCASAPPPRFSGGCRPLGVAALPACRPRCAAVWCRFAACPPLSPTWYVRGEDGIRTRTSPWPRGDSCPAMSGGSPEVRVRPPRPPNPSPY